jgi:hypothetical protein
VERIIINWLIETRSWRWLACEIRGGQILIVHWLGLCASQKARWPVRLLAASWTSTTPAKHSNIIHTFELKEDFIRSQHQLWVVRVTGDPKLDTWEPATAVTIYWSVIYKVADSSCHLLLSHQSTSRKTWWWRSAILTGPGDQSTDQGKLEVLWDSRKQYKERGLRKGIC